MPSQSLWVDYGNITEAKAYQEEIRPMLNFFVGPIWGSVFLGLGICLAAGAAFIFFSSGTSRWNQKMPRAIFMPSLMGIAALLFVFLALFAFKHYRTPINHRALEIDKINQQLVRVTEAGVHPRPLFGLKVEFWPAHTGYTVSLDMSDGISSAPSKDTKTPLKIALKSYFDLSNLDIEAAFDQGFTSWELFYRDFLLHQMGGVSRYVVQKYTVDEHSTKTDEWEETYEHAMTAFIQGDEDEAFGIRVVEGRSVMTWDFVSGEDAEQYDDSNRANFAITTKANQIEAAKKDGELALQQSAVLSSMTTSTISATQQVVAFMGELSPQEQEIAMRYWDSLENIWYLRLIEDKSPEIFFPPQSQSPTITWDLAAQGVRIPQAPIPAAPGE